MGSHPFWCSLVSKCQREAGSGVDEGSARGSAATLLDLVVRALETVNAGADPREQICADLVEICDSATSVYVTSGPAGSEVLGHTGPIDWGLVERALWLLSDDRHPFLVREPRGECAGACLPLAVSPARTTALVLSGSCLDTVLLEEAGRALREVDELVARLPRACPDDVTAGSLTPREGEVLGLLAEGLLATTIAARLAVSPRTVHHHLGSIYEKLGVSDRLGAVLRARARGLLPGPGASGPPLDDRRAVSVPR